MRRRLLAWLKVREQPDPPPGSGPSLETFRASERYLYLSALAWLPKQVSALVGLVFALLFFGTLQLPGFDIEGPDRFFEFFEKLDIGIGGWNVEARSLLDFFELLAVLTFALQLIFSGLMLKLSWELRWYMVGDASLRIREGLWLLREQTVTIANIQNMTVRQGPLQKLFGVADLEVQTAGGGSSASASKDLESAASPLHVARFRGLEDAQGLRDRIQERLIRYKGAGLGDADDIGEEEPGDAGPEPRELTAAAVELRDEARALRRALGGALRDNVGR